MSDDDDGDDDDDEPLFPDAREPRSACIIGRETESDRETERDRNPTSSACSIYGAAEAAQQAAARSVLAAWQRRLDAETEQFRVWRTETEAEAREATSALALLATELGERLYAGPGVAVSRLSMETVQLTALAYPMAPVTHALSPPALAAAQRVVAARERLARADHMLSAASSFQQIEEAKQAYDAVLAVDATNQRARDGSERANARLDQTLAVHDRSSLAPSRPSLEGLGGGASQPVRPGAMDSSEAERVARLLQAEVTEMRTVIERLESELPANAIVPVEFVFNRGSVTVDAHVKNP